MVKPVENRETMTPKEALDILIAGNERFVNGTYADKDLRSLVQLIKEKQQPFAAILSCSDSRAPVELIFDQALGDVFSVRLAGNIASDKCIGSLEFSMKHLNSKLIVVMGHTSCGAVKAACDDFQEGHIGEITNLIKPAIRYEKSITDPALRNSSNAEYVQKINVLNVRHQIDSILRSSDIITNMLEAHKIGIVGATYDLDTMKVNFMEDTFKF